MSKFHTFESGKILICGAQYIYEKKPINVVNKNKLEK